MYLMYLFCILFVNTRGYVVSVLRFVTNLFTI